MLEELEPAQCCCNGYGKGYQTRLEEGSAGDQDGRGEVDEVDVLRRQWSRRLGGEFGGHPASSLPSVVLCEEWYVQEERERGRSESEGQHGIAGGSMLVSP